MGLANNHIAKEMF